MAIPEETPLRKMEIERDNALGLARGFRDEVECLKGNHEELMEALRKERFDSASRLAAMTILKVDLEAMTEERDRQRTEVRKLRAKLTPLENAARDAVEDDHDEDCEDDNGRYRAENDFDTRDHYREM